MYILVRKSEDLRHSRSKCAGAQGWHLANRSDAGLSI